MPVLPDARIRVVRTETVVSVVTGCSRTRVTPGGTTAAAAIGVVLPLELPFLITPVPVGTGCGRIRVGGCEGCFVRCLQPPAWVAMFDLSLWVLGVHAAAWLCMLGRLWLQRAMQRRRKRF
jgi:type IV secretory pathway TrbD component